MELTGLGATQLLTVLGIASAIAVVLYLLRLRRRRVFVPFVRLWDTVLSEQKSTRLFSKLKRWLSLLVALCIIALLSFALGDPRFAGAHQDGRTMVVLMDTSASMQATDVAPSRLHAAIKQVQRLIRRLGPADRMLIARFDAAATPLSPLTGDVAVLERALRGLNASDVPANLAGGVHLALNVLSETSRPEIVIASDGQLQHAHSVRERIKRSKVRVSWIRVGSKSENLGITSFGVRRYPLDKSQVEALIEIWNPTAKERSVEITLFGDGKPIDVQTLQVRPGERLRRFFGDLSGIDRTLEARLRAADRGNDHLAVDNRAYATLSQRRRARVLAVTEGNLYLQAALLLDEYLDVEEIAPADYPNLEKQDGLKRFDVVLFDNWVPRSAPSRPALYLNPSPSSKSDASAFRLFSVRGETVDPYFAKLKSKHPILRWTALRDVNIARAHQVVPEPGDDVIGGDQGTPLIVSGERDSQPMVAFTFDIRQSDLPLRVAWPLLLLNTIDFFVEDSSDDRSSLRTGETWRIPVSAEATRAKLVPPRGDSRFVPVQRGHAVHVGTQTGIYSLRTKRDHAVFAANLGDSAESDIRPVETLRVDGMRAGAVSSGRPGLRKEIWLYLVFAALCILIVEWFTYHRRHTV